MGSGLARARQDGPAWRTCRHTDVIWVRHRHETARGAACCCTAQVAQQAESRVLVRTLLWIDNALTA